MQHKEREERGLSEEEEEEHGHGQESAKAEEKSGGEACANGGSTEGLEESSEAIDDVEALIRATMIRSTGGAVHPEVQSALAAARRKLGVKTSNSEQPPPSQDAGGGKSSAALPNCSRRKNMVSTIPCLVTGFSQE